MSYVGRPLKRFEDARLITGNGVFINDIKLPHMLHAAIVRSDHAHARIRSIDIAAARGLAGVVEVLTGAGLAGALPDIPIRAMGDRAVEVFNAARHPVLARDKVCYVGQPVAVVVADNPYVARDGAELVAVDYEILTPVIDPDTATDEDMPVIHPDFVGDTALFYTSRQPNGSRADVRAKGEWRDGVWTVEFARKLVTNHSDDIQFDLDRVYRFGVSRYEIAGRKRNPKLEQPWFGAGEITGPLTLKFVRQAVANR